MNFSPRIRWLASACRPAGLLRCMLVIAFLVPMAVHAERSITVAVASNFATTAAELAASFSTEHDIQVRISSGSTGLLYAQITQGAPYDVFLSADQTRPQLLSADGYGVATGHFDYARGFLVLWSTDSAYRDKDCSAALRAGEFRRLAIANPKVAPYGAAARDYLQEIGLFDSVASKLVYGENISQAFQFVSTENASLGLIALSQVVHRRDSRATCFDVLRPPRARSVVQSGLVLRRSQDLAAAILFADYLASDSATQILRASGYDIVQNATVLER